MNKREVIADLLERGAVHVVVDGRRCVVPPHLRAPGLTLAWGWNLPGPIRDLCVGEKDLSGTLSFDGKPYTCVLPWEAVFEAYVLGEEHHVVWPRDFPRPESLAACADSPIAVAPQPAFEKPKPAKKTRGHLRLVTDDDMSEGEPA